jgi:enoyl-CoA hydratase
MDLILTGRSVTAQEALQIGLANRLVPKGSARAAAEELAAQLATLPQECMRNDRRAALECLELPFGEAMDRELQLGRGSLAKDGLAGAAQFSAGGAKSRPA